MRERLIAFVIVGLRHRACGGALYAHFLGVVNPDAFYLGLTFITLSMLVVGGMNSLSGAVLGVIVISAIIQLLRWLEKGIDLGSDDAVDPQRPAGDHHRHGDDRHSDVQASRPDAQSRARLAALALRQAVARELMARSAKPIEDVH